MITRRVTALIKRRLWLPLLDLLKQGITPQKLALTVALGAVVGLLPFLGATTFVCAALAWRLRLNMAGTLLVSYAVYPLQLVLFIPFLNLGNNLFGQRPLPLSASEVIAKLQQDWLEVLNQLWLANLAGLLVWLIMAIPMAFLIYYLLLPVFRRVVTQIAS